MIGPDKNPRILIVTPEVTFLPPGMGNGSNYLTAKAGGLGDVSAGLIQALYDQGADVHVAIPDYRTMFNSRLPKPLKRHLRDIKTMVPGERLHLAVDRVFFYLGSVYSSGSVEALKQSLAFQREVINNIIPSVQPDLIHCHDWTTGLIPAGARCMGIPCLFTVHNIHTFECPLSDVDDRGIDCMPFWQALYFDHIPNTYENALAIHQVDFLASGIFGAHFVNTVSRTFLNEMIRGQHTFVPKQIRQELANKVSADCATGILNAPHPSYNPATDRYLPQQYCTADHGSAKKLNKTMLQRRLGLTENQTAPLFFWPSRLDNTQKGCQLLADILYTVISRYWENDLQIVFVADGPFSVHFNKIADFHGFHHRMAVCDFDEALARMAYGASDFILMPSLYEPCGLPQMIGMIYGALPVAHDTGGLHDTIRHLSIKLNKGNGFLFKNFDSQGLLWAIDQAMTFYMLPVPIRHAIIARVMQESIVWFNHAATAEQYIQLYERMLQRPLLTDTGKVVIKQKNKTDSKELNNQQPNSVIPVDSVMIEADNPQQWKMAKSLR